ncbi:SH3 domain-containing protein [Sulfitobacter marinus]|uniref:SH3 domain-containing protein n=1 Tax=Sulfitobacter marinus TaxID=394264 RepID=A0A1I6VLG8_9RHOB|nr:SH3 domain-containing protein [Sulfitobacter marinus]SFT14539.1 SH3 domain-containing protein [Sulfitobacter marinus]
MKRFILLTFGFLGLAFYELSGGADFEPPRPPVIEASITEGNVADDGQQIEVARAAPQIAPHTPQGLADIGPVDTTPPGFSMTSDNETTQVDDLVAAAGTAVTPAKASLANEVNVVPVNLSTTSGQATSAIIPSLITPDDTGATAINAGGSGDIRSVSGSSVNVRGGPGTQYDVVTQLTRGDTVEIIDDSGNGWVQMRPLSGGPVGWMADFLLSEV